MSLMKVNGYYAEINCPEALTGDTLHSLPPYARVLAHVVDEYPACPKEWMHGSGKASSYFIGVEPGKGMWFDFTMNYYDYDYAVVISVQGINPLTGQKMNGLSLEQYKNQCPTHKIDFQQDRFCSECKYKWPAQNYISTTTGQQMWLDGFRNESGEVRQYILTEEEVNRGVAQQMIGDDRVWAIGFAFYRSKNKKPIVVRSLGVSKPLKFASKPLKFANAVYGAQNHIKSGPCGQSLNSSTTMCTEDYATMDCEERTSFDEIVSAKKVEIGAGSRINQEIGVDNKDIDYWESEPIGLIYVNYTTLEHANEILAAGKRVEVKDGFLSQVAIGN